MRSPDSAILSRMISQATAQEHTAANTGEIQLTNVTREYVTGSVSTLALDDVSLDIPSGQFVVMLGPSGSGKSTLLNIIGGIDKPTTGSALVAGMDISTLSDGALTQYRREKVGFVFQFFNLVPTLTARENVDLVAGLVGRSEAVDRALEDVGLTDRADHFPGQLSGGQQQRVAIARALVKDPPILLCDEPTGALDFETGKMVLGLIRQMARDSGKTVVVVTHNAAIARMADRVVRLRSGAVTDDSVVENPITADQLEW